MMGTEYKFNVEVKISKTVVDQLLLSGGGIWKGNARDKDSPDPCETDGNPQWTFWGGPFCTNNKIKVSIGL